MQVVRHQDVLRSKNIQSEYTHAQQQLAQTHTHLADVGRDNQELRKQCSVLDRELSKVNVCIISMMYDV